ncbi:MAG TPA: type II toxin-antitoxin system HipA family toxin [Solirubrobacterales bacterium]|nr:type II toxin-antitoxin system HipA family toxin [Solirubrobacterales bacterium]
MNWPYQPRRRWVPPRPGSKLAVFMGSQLAGTLERRGPSRYRFSYSNEEAPRLSVSLPPREQSFKPSESAPFFEGLLPEGSVRRAVAEKLRLSEEDGFGMLEALGADCAGAVVILPAGERPRPRIQGEQQPLASGELSGMLEDLPRDPLGIDLEPDGVRLSLGGVQDKLVLVRLPTGEFAKPRGGEPSTCLLKPGSGRYPGLVANEAFCMEVARSVGADVADTQVFTVGSFRCLLVDRFDRARDESEVVRLHQEDMCQALGILPSAKYEANGGPSAVQVIALLRRLGTRRTALDVNAFVRALVIDFLLGNSDAHGKNFSLLYANSGVRLAPLYDIVSTAVYPEVTGRLAMSIGGEDDPSRVDLASWERLGREGGLGGVLTQFVRRWSAEVLAGAEECQVRARSEGWYDPVIDAIVEVCRDRAGRLIRVS